MIVARQLLLYAVSWGIVVAKKLSSCGDIAVTEGKAGQLTTLYNDVAACASGSLLSVKWTGLVELTTPIIVNKGSALEIIGQGDDAQVDGGSISRLFILDEGASLELTNMRITNGNHEPSDSFGSFGRRLLAEAEDATLDPVPVPSRQLANNKAGGSGTDTYTTPSSITAFDSHALSFSYSSFSFGGFQARVDGGGAIYGGFDCSVTLTDCVFEGNAAATGGALFTREGSTVSITSTQFIGNTATDFGGAVYLIGSLEMEDSSFTDNSAGTGGGALGVSPASRVTMRGTNLTNNIAESSGGGGIYASAFDAFVDFDAETGTLADDQPDKVIYMTLERCRLTNNTAFDGQGGGIRVRGGAILNITNSVIEENNGREGGGIMLEAAVAFVQDSSFLGNVGNTAGGGSYVVTGSGVWFDSCLFQDNVTPGNGGGVYSADGSTVSLSSCTVGRNVAGNGGGALSLQYADVMVTNTNFTFNTASSTGSTAYLFFSSVSIENSTFTDATVFSVSTITLSQCDDVSLSALQMDFSKSVADEGELARSSAISMAGAVVDAYDIDFNGWEGDNVVSNVEGTLTLDKADFLSCSAPLLVSSSSTAVTIVRNPLLNTENYPADSNTLVIDGQTCANSPCKVQGAICVEGFNGDLFCSCYKSNIAGKVCTSTSADLLVAVDDADAAAVTVSATAGAALSVIDLSASDGSSASAALVAYYPAEAASTYVITPLWDDPAQTVIWHANTTINGESGGMTLTTVPSAGLLAGGSSASIIVTASVSSSSAPAANAVTDATFSLSAVGSDGVQVASLSQPIEVDIWLCEAYFYWDGSACQSCSGTLLGEGISGVDCSEPGSTLQTLVIKKGYWRADETSVNIKRCRVGSACAGGSEIEADPDNYCAIGYKGPYCAVCDSGYGSSLGGKCHECSASAQAGLFVLVSIFFLAFAVFMYYVVQFLIRPVRRVSASNSDDAAQQTLKEYRAINRAVSRNKLISDASGGTFASTLKIILVATQIITQYCDVVDVEFTGVYAKMLDVLNVFNFNLSFLASATCVADTNLYDSVVILTVAPVVVIMLLGVTYMIAEARSRGTHQAASAHPKPSAIPNNTTWLMGPSLSLSNATAGDGDHQSQTNANNQSSNTGGEVETMSAVLLSMGAASQASAHNASVNKVSAKLTSTSARPLPSAPPPNSSRHLNDGGDLLVSAHGGDEGEETKEDGRVALRGSAVGLTSSFAKRHGGGSRPSNGASVSHVSYGGATVHGGDEEEERDGEEEEEDEDEQSEDGGLSSVTTWPEVRTIIRKKHVTVLVAFFFVMYCTLSTVIFQVLSPCDKLDDGRSYLRADYSLECSGPQYNAMYIYCAVMVFFYPVGIPAMFTYILRRYRPRLLVDKRTDSGRDMRVADPKIAHLKFLWNGYRPQAYYYELVEFARRLMLSSLLVFVVPNSVGQEATACMLAFFFATAFEALAPMMEWEEKYLYRSTCVFIFVVVFFSLVAKIDVSGDTNYDQRVYEVTLVAMNVLLVMLFIVNWVLQAYWLGKGVRKALIRRESSNMGSLFSQNPEQSIRDSKQGSLKSNVGGDAGTSGVVASQHLAGVDEDEGSEQSEPQQDAGSDSAAEVEVSDVQLVGKGGEEEKAERAQGHEQEQDGEEEEGNEAAAAAAAAAVNEGKEEEEEQYERVDLRVERGEETTVPWASE